VFPTITAIVTLDKFEHEHTPPSKFLIPRDYNKVMVPFSLARGSNLKEWPTLVG
jgi:hypothetical protein